MSKSSGGTRTISRNNAAQSRTQSVANTATSSAINALIDSINSKTLWNDKVKFLKNDAANESLENMTKAVSAVYNIKPSEFKKVEELEDVTFNKKKGGSIFWEKYRENETDTIEIGTINRHGKIANIVRTYEESGWKSLTTYYINGYKTGGKDKSVLQMFDKLVKAGKIK